MQVPSLSAGRPAAVLLLALLGLAVLSGRVDAEAPLVTGVRVECRVDVDERSVRRMVGVTEGEAWDPLRVPQIVKRLEETELYAEVQVEAVESPGGVEVVVRLVRKPVVARVRFVGNDTLDSETLRRVTRLQEGVAFTTAAGDYAVERVHETYVAEGFQEVQVSLHLFEEDPGEIDVAIYVDEGEPLTVAAIEFGGDRVLPDADLGKAAQISVGDRLRSKLRREAERGIEAALRKLGYYEADVTPEWQLISPYEGVLRFKIESGPRFQVAFEGNSKLADDTLLDLIDLEKRVVVTDGTWRELARRIRRAYQAEGFFLVKVTLSLATVDSFKTVRFDIDEGENFRVAPIEFEGGVNIPLKVLREAMLTGPPGWVPWRKGTLVDDTFSDDLKRLWFLLRRWGYLDGQIADYRIKPDPTSHLLQVTVVVEPGPQTVVRAIEWEGFDAVEGVEPVSLLEVGQPLNAAAMEADRENMTAALRDAGYLDATVTSQTTVNPDGEGLGALVRYTAQAGSRWRVGNVIVQNNFDTQTRVVRRELPFKEGDVLSNESLLLGQANLYRLGLFRSVTVEPLPASGDATTRDVAVNVSERPPISLQFGSGYNTRDGFRGFVELADSNLQGRARRLSLRGDVALDPSQGAQPSEYLGDLGFREPRIFDSRFNLRTNFVGQRATRSIDQFSIERLAFIPAIERTLLPGLQGGMELQVEDARIFDVKPDVLAFNPRDQGHLFTTSIGPYLVYEGRDDAFAPTRGVFESVRVRYAAGWLGSDIPLVKLQAHHSQYIPVGDGMTFVYAARAGWARTIDSANTVPLRERFFLGGRSTVRGFSENSIGPQGARIFNQYGGVVNEGGDPLGGDIAINLNAELRVPLLFGVSGVLFTDGGGVYLHNLPMSIDDFRRSAGLGLLYTTPVGPIALHYGFKLDRRPDESLGEVDFSIGTIF